MIDYFIKVENYKLTLRKTPPRNGEGKSQTSPPALSGKGDGGLGRMRKVNYKDRKNFCSDHPRRNPEGRFHGTARYQHQQACAGY